MARRLSHKQKKFVKEIVKGKTGVEAALNSYDTEDYGVANAIAVENLQKPAIIKSIEESLPDELLSKVHLEGLFADKGVYKTSDGKTWQRVDDEPDYSVRHKYLDTAYKLKGKYKDINIEQQLIVNFSPISASKYGIDRAPSANNQ